MVAVATRSVATDEFIGGSIREDLANFITCLLYTSPSPRDS